MNSEQNLELSPLECNCVVVARKLHEFPDTYPDVVVNTFPDKSWACLPSVTSTSSRFVSRSCQDGREATVLPGSKDSITVSSVVWL